MLSISLLKKEFKEVTREKKILIISIFYISITVLAFVFTKYIPQILRLIFPKDLNGMQKMINQYLDNLSEKNYIDQFSKLYTQLGFIVTSIIFCDYITKELEDNRIYSLFPMGITRLQFIATKSFVLNTICISTSIVVFLLYTLFLYITKVDISDRLFSSYVVLLLKYIILILMLVFSSTITKKSWQTLLLTLFSYEVLNVLRYVPILKNISPFYYIYNFGVNNGFKEILSSISITVAYFVGIQLISFQMFKERDL